MNAEILVSVIAFVQRKRMDVALYPFTCSANDTFAEGVDDT